MQILPLFGHARHWETLLSTLLIAMTFERIAAPNTVVVVTDTTLWRAIGPAGNQEATPIDAVGLAWESTNDGWNNSVSYDDSSATGWHAPISRGADAAFNYIWSEGPLYFGDTPSYFRTTFSLGSVVTSGLLDFYVDDDAQIWLNGLLVVNDANNVATTSLNLNVTSRLKPGLNLLAVKAHDSFTSAPPGLNGEAFALRIDAETSGLGDYNFNDVVDAADYVVWRKGLGTTFTQSDYDTWRAHFGQTAGSGAALGEFATRPVPEPGTFALLLSVSAMVRHTRMAHGRRPIK